MTGSVITRIFLYNANDNDRFIVDGRELQVNSPRSTLAFDDLEIHFVHTDFEEAVQSGLIDAISPIALNSDDLRGANRELSLPAYYRRKNVTISLK